ncbi:MAG: hypothetical protein INR69_24120, partial [Mucilaginibacter polytrichastri]|nr:hypothetical protein [Mucilaginibacter polytrichastri]
MNTPQNKQNDRQDEIGARIDDTGKGAEKDAVKDGNWKQHTVHDLPQDEQMH